MRVLMVSSEMTPWAKTGGLADVLGALPVALERLGHDVTVVLPRYRGNTAAGSRAFGARLHLGAVNVEVTLSVADLSEHRRVVFVDCPPLFDRDGLYGA